jgi:hypothetical protein
MPPVRTTPAHRADMEKLGKALLKAAIEHDLCDEFFDVIEEINSELTVPLAVRKPSTPADLTYSLIIRANVDEYNAGTWQRGTSFSAEQEKAITDAINNAVIALDFVEEILQLDCDEIATV